MNFITDKQTLDDLNIIGKTGRESIYGIFNKTVSTGGAALLEDMFMAPLGSSEAIAERSSIISFIKALGLQFPLKAETVASANFYLNNRDQRSRLRSEHVDLASKLKGLLVEDTQQKLVVNGIVSVFIIMHQLDVFFRGIPSISITNQFSRAFELMGNFRKEKQWEIVFNKSAGHKLASEELVELDTLFRFSESTALSKLFELIYLLDAYITVANIATQRNYIFPKVTANETTHFKIEGLYHPSVTGAVSNSVNITGDKNILFLTGANMAGKSTFMKSLGVAIYLSHMGFPVPAEAMEFSVLDGLLTTINLSDNINAGYSHFYAEVLRLKKMAQLVAQGKKMFLIVDELFRGTNVKDAYDATVAITGAIAKKENCTFLVSTHILEAGVKLQEKFSNINFIYLPTRLVEGTPKYTYRLENGISDDRHGMVIIHQEKILEILKLRNPGPLKV